MKRDYLFYLGLIVGITNILMVFYFIAFTPTEYFIATIPQFWFNWLLAYIPIILIAVSLVIMIRDFKEQRLRSLHAFVLATLALLPTCSFFILSMLFGGKP